MVAHFKQKHNRALSKHIRLFQIFGFICCFFIQSYSFAKQNDGLIVINNNSKDVLVSSQFRVYHQEARQLNFDEFQRTKSLMPYHIYENPNYGFVNNGVWLYARIENKSDINDWMIRIGNSQLQDVRLYLLSEGEIIYQGTDGISNKQSPYATPNFQVNIPQEKITDIYIYVRNVSMSLMAPVYLQTQQKHASIEMAEHSAWGIFYGAITVLFFCAGAFLFYSRRTTSAVYLAHLVVIFLFQIIWSGHFSLMPTAVIHFFLFLKLESLILLGTITTSFFTLFLVPPKLISNQLKQAILGLIALQSFFLLIFLTKWLPNGIAPVLTYLLGFGTILLNIVAYYRALKCDYFPARPMLAGWIIAVFGSITSIFFVFGIFSTNHFHPMIFHFTVVAQSVASLLSIVMNKQFHLQQEVKEAQTDAENNFYLVEEQNVHLDIARKEAVKASEVKSQFLANMSHEIRTPLNAIIGFSKELEARPNIAEHDEHVRIINASATDLLTVVNDILDFSKMEAGKLTLNIKPFSPRDLLEDVAALMSKSAHLKQLEFIFDVKDLPPYLLGDGFKIKQLLSNLLSNALKFTNYGHITLRARTSNVTETHCNIEFHVQDTGIGILEEDMKKLFTAFHQLDDELNRSFQGTGLGLVICQELTSLMSGTIKVLSSPTKGSTFIASIPFKIDTSTTHASLASKFTDQTAYIFDNWQPSKETNIQTLEAAGFSVISVDSIAEIEKLNVGQAFVFVSIPYQSIDERSTIIEKLSVMSLENLVLLFSGPSPTSQQINKVRNFPKLIRLPLSTRKLNDIDKSQITDHPSEERSKLAILPDIRILAVDDMELNLRLLDTWLTHSKVSLDLAYSGESAIELCQTFEYDLILMDIQMPSMDGIEATSHIRKSELNIGTPIIAVTAHALESQKQHFLDSGLDDFLAKPINLDNLIGLVNTWCPSIENDIDNNSDTEVFKPAVDWAMAKERTSNKADEAFKFLDDFVSQLKDFAVTIEQAWEQQNSQLLKDEVHKVHGACYYTGLPRLEECCQKTETLLKTTPLEKNSKAISTLLFEIEQTIEVWSATRKNYMSKSKDK
ncbi:hybrid sensor histidine kinase/response regulator [Glaciecola petra]|uniref:histidine kinase n=1 Tax=Glaciecola petra TaxID=3075602 RepID=A0ABU2ZVF1_9ALTE|nr:response regulator [Aestuariibacter sp. P117]MDT0595564.1 response regulator [Aestuariibacter sp. P117]